MRFLLHWTDGDEGTTLVCGSRSLDAQRPARADSPLEIRPAFSRAGLGDGHGAHGSHRARRALAVRFGGQPHARDRLPSLVVIGLIALCALYAIVRREHIRSAIDRGREPFLRPLSNISGFDGAADALAACPDAFKTRFAIGWIWRPLALFGLGIVCAFSTAYFVIDAALARFRVGWGQPAYAAGFLVLGLVVFALSAVKLSTWRLAVSVYKDVTSGYRA